MTILRVLAIAVTLAAFLTTASTQAATNFTDRSAWQTAAGGGTGDIFDDFNDVINDINDLNPALDRGPYSILEGGEDMEVGIDGTGNGLFTNGDVNGTSYLRAELEDEFTEIDDEVTFIFDAPIIALGYDLNPYPGSNMGSQVVFLADTGEAGGYTLPATDITVFQGFIFDAPITSIVLRAPIGSGFFSQHGIDNIEAFSAPSTIPAPAALPAGIALLGMLATKRRRQHRNA